MRLEELSRVLRDVDPAIVLLTQPVMVRVVQAVAGLNWTVWRVPHAHCLMIDRRTLYKHVEQEELYPHDAQPPEVVLLLERPTAEQLNGPTNDLLGRYWRLLFHAAAHRELEQRLVGLTPAGLRERIEHLGPAAFEEARNVLVQDAYLVPDPDDRATYVELAATYLELRYFHSNLLSVYFPSLPAPGEVESFLSRDIDGAGLFKKTRPQGAPDPAPKTDDQSDESHDYYDRLTRAARRAAAAGDTVAAGILHTKAARVAPASKTVTAQNAARADIYNLVGRLQKALGLSDEEAEPWRRVLPTLLDKADQGARPVEASLLYDLQRACLEHEQTIYALNVVEWVLRGGHKPLKRELKSQKFVRVPAQLRNATRRLTAARLNDADRQALGTLLRDAQNRAEDRLRGEFRPILENALRDAGLDPHSLPEQAALKKTVEELLDRISATGYLSFGDLRDAIARGQMKLPDLTGPHEYVRGDPLLRLDRRLASQLDGVYRGAESYTRGLERLTAINFGTPAGRWITRNITLPFGIACLVFQFIWLLVYERINKGVPLEEQVPFWLGWNAEWWFHLSWLGLGLFLLATFRSATLRGALHSVGRGLYNAGRFVFWDLPARAWANPWVRAVVASWPLQLALNYGVKPLLVSSLLWFRFTEQLWDPWPARIITLIAAGFVVNTAPGRLAQEALVEFFRATLRLLRSFPALLRWINDIFREMVDVLEWVLARTEDWLRIRGRSGPVAVAVKAIAGLIWMPFAFLIRFYSVVLIEPMINPLKLPLSILFAKFVYPLLAVAGFFTLQPLGSPLVDRIATRPEDGGFVVWYATAWLLVVGTFYLLPDAVTFLFWEMRENWRLYRANRPTTIKPVIVGEHGETVRGLLHYGFHSGTVPRLFNRLRAAEREAALTDNWREARTHRQHLRGAQEAVQRFVMRDLVAVLNPAWSGPFLCVGDVELGTNRIRVALVPPGAGAKAWLEWEDRSGRLVAGMADAGFLDELSADARRVFQNALAYLYKRAGVDLVEEQVRAALPAAADFDITADGLLVWYGSRDEVPLLYDMTDPAGELRARSPTNLKPVPGPSLKAERLLFNRLQLTWAQWTQLWQAGQTEQPPPRFGPPDWELTLLPPPPPKPPAATGEEPSPVPPPSADGPPPSHEEHREGTEETSTESQDQ